MLGAQRQLDVVSNNLANVSTTGYKRQEIAFGATLEQALRANGGQGPMIGTMSMGAGGDMVYTAFQVGQIKQTGNPYDFALETEKGLFAVQTPNGTRYTRDGSFRLTEEGMLVTQDNYPVLSDTGEPIQLPMGEMTTQANGTISVDGIPVGRIGVFEGQFTKEGKNLFASADARESETVSIRWQAIENSNVNAVEAMAEMIQLQRRFELAQKSIQQQDELTQRLIQSLSQS